MSLIVAGVAAYRFVRAWFWEPIGEPFRDRAEKWTAPKFTVWSEDGETAQSIEFEDRPVRDWLNGLVSCPYCFGFWITLAMLIGLRIPGIRRLVQALAASMILTVALDYYPDKAREEHDDS